MAEESNNQEGQHEESFFKKFIVYFVIFGLVFGTIAVVFMVIGVLWWKTNGLQGGYGGPTIDCTSAKAFADKPVEWKVWTAQAANKYLEGDQAILIALIQQESGWTPTSQSSTGPLGLGQFAKATAKGLRDIAVEKDNYIFFPGLNSSPEVEDRTDPEKAIPGAAYYLRQGMETVKKKGLHNTPKEELYRWAYIDEYHRHANQSQLNEAVFGAKKILEYYSSMISDGSCKASDEGGGTPDGDEAGDGCEGNTNGLGVPCYDQRYTWSNSKGNVACGMTSIYMVLKYYAEKGININAKYLDAKTIGQSSYFYPYIKTKGYFSAGIGSTRTYSAQIRGSADWSVIKSQLGAGNPVVLYTNHLPGHSDGHVVVLVGYKVQDGSTFYYYNDPWGAKRKTIIQDQLNNMLDYPGGRAYLYADIY